MRAWILNFLFSGNKFLMNEYEYIGLFVTFKKRNTFDGKSGSENFILFCFNLNALNTICSKINTFIKIENGNNIISIFQVI